MLRALASVQHYCRQMDGEKKPVSYISKSLTPTEQRYAQIEKEALAFTWACERFSDYLVGLPFSIETDHKPLVPLFSTKSLDELPIRVQRFRLRMMRFDFSIYHVPGKDLTVHSMTQETRISSFKKKYTSSSTKHSRAFLQPNTGLKISSNTRDRTKPV